MSDDSEGNLIELVKGPDGYVLKPKRIDYSRIGTLADKIPPEHPPFDIREFRDLREQAHGPSVQRDD